MSGRGVLIDDVYEMACDLYVAAKSLTEPDADEPSAVRSILRAGRPDLLRGRYESHAFECKSRPYDLDTQRSRIELARDVAGFANSESDALIVLGLKTKADGVGDRVTAVRPIQHRIDRSRYRKVIDQLLYPPLERLEIEATTASTRGGKEGQLVSIYVPRQPGHLKPFLVSGAIVEDSVEGAFISIVRRRGDESIPVRAQDIHAALALGRRILHTTNFDSSKDEARG